MKIVNKSEKLIFVNGKSLLPDASVVADEKVYNAPAIRAMIDKGELALDDSDEVKKVPIETPVEEVAEKTEEAPVARRGRRAKATEETANE